MATTMQARDGDLVTQTERRRLRNATKMCEDKFSVELATSDMHNWSEYEKSQRTLKKKIMDALFEATYVSDKEMPGYSTAASVYSFAFLFVLVGVELDFWGFIIAFPQYWKYDGPHNLIVKIFLICMPVAYTVSVLWCYIYERPQKLEDIFEQLDQNEEVGKRSSPKVDIDPFQITPQQAQGVLVSAPSPLAEIFSTDVRNTQDHSSRSIHPGTPREATADTRVTVERKADLTVKVQQQRLMQSIREKPSFLWFRTVPLARLYLVTKNLKRDDVELIFRLNSLSSFSLGVSQLVCVAFTVLVAGQPLNTIVIVNMMSQAINWMITFIYYATALADHMKASIAIKAVSQHLRDRQQQDLVHFFQAVTAVADKKAESEVQGILHVENNGKEVDEVQRIKCSLLAEIFFLTKCDVNLDKFSVAELLDYRSRLYKKQIHNMMRG